MAGLVGGGFGLIFERVEAGPVGGATLEGLEVTADVEVVVAIASGDPVAGVVVEDVVTGVALGDSDTVGIGAVADDPGIFFAGLLGTSRLLLPLGGPPSPRSL